MLGKNEIDAIVEMLYEDWPDIEKDWYRKNVEFLEEMGYEINFVKNGGEYGGFIIHKGFDPLEIRHIRYLIIDKRFRGKGYGSALMEGVEKYAGERGEDFIFLETDVCSNWRFFIKKGFKKIDGVELYFPDETDEGEPYHIFVKPINDKHVLTPGIVRLYYESVEPVHRMGNENDEEEFYKQNREIIGSLKEVRLVVPSEL